jgi:hypothetical protein
MMRTITPSTNALYPSLVVLVLAAHPATTVVLTCCLEPPNGTQC